jgi:hypothetical protein
MNRGLHLRPPKQTLAQRSTGRPAWNGSGVRFRGVDRALSSCGDDVIGWSMRPWESVPAPGGDDAESHGRMDQPMRGNYQSSVVKRLTGQPWAKPRHDKGKQSPDTYRDEGLKLLLGDAGDGRRVRVDAGMAALELRSTRPARPGC